MPLRSGTGEVMVRFEYVAPENLEEGVALLRLHGEDAKVIAGGQSLLILMREGALRPRYVVGLERIPGLASITGDDDHLVIGAMATYRTVYRSDRVRQAAGLLARACESVGPLPIHSVGTIGGNLCHNAPGADPPAALLALDARAVLVGANGQRTLPLREFFPGMFETAVDAGEILTAIAIPSLPRDARWSYLKFSRRAMDMAIASVAVVIRLEQDGICREARLGVGGAAAVPYRATRVEEALIGSHLTPAVIADACASVTDGVELVADFHASSAYRRKVLPVLVRRAIRLALAEPADSAWSSDRSGERR